MANGTGAEQSGQADRPLEETSFVTRLPIGRGSILNSIYRIERQLGVGGMGEVYEAVNIEDGEREAIKIISTSLAEQEKVEALFRREAKTLRKLSAPEIAQLRFFARDPDMNVLYIVTEFVDGLPLGSLLKGIPAPAEKVRILLRRVGRGLKAAHDLGLIHRDISPDNILVPEGKVELAKIIDFGIAKDVTNKGTTIIGDSFVGKLSYASPEVFSFGKSEIGPWSDIYSLGLVGAAYALGEPLNMGDSFPAAMAARQSRINLGDIPPSLQRVLERMLEPDWNDRMQSVDELLVALDPTATTVSMPAPAATPSLPEPAPQAATIPQQLMQPHSNADDHEDAQPRSGKGRLIAIVAAVALLLGLAIPPLLSWVNGGRQQAVAGNLAEEMTLVADTDDPAKWQTLYAVREIAVRSSPIVKASEAPRLLPRGTSVRGALVPGTKDKTKPWLLIQEGEYKGKYVSAINLTKAAPPEIDTSTAAEMTMGGAGSVHAGPYSSAATLPGKEGKLEPGDPVKVAGTVNADWAEVTLKDGGVGYVLWTDISSDDGSGVHEWQQSATFNPSFDCTAAGTYVLITICQSETLARKDRDLSTTFKSLLSSAHPEARAPLLTNQRRLLALRDACGDSACIEQWYDARIEEYTAQ